MVRVQKVVSLAIGMDSTEFDRAMRKMYSELGKARTATRPLSDSMAVLKEALTKVTATSEQVEIVQNRLTIQAAKRAEQIRKEAAAVRELTNAENRRRGLSTQASIQAERDAVDSSRRALEKRLEIFKRDKAAKEQAAQAAIRLAEAEEAAARRIAAASYVGIPGSGSLNSYLNNTAPNSDPLGVSGYRGSAGSGAGYVPGMGSARDLSQFQAMLKGGAGTGASGWAAGASATGAAYREAAAGAKAWAAGLKEVKDRADAANASAKSAEIQAGLDRRAARRGSRSAFADALDEVLPIKLNNQRQLADAGRGYMSQFNDGRQNAVAQFREANALKRQGVISAEQYARAIAGIRAQNNELAQSFTALRTAVTTLLGPLVLVYTAYRGFVGSIKLSAELDEARAKFRVFTGSMAEASRILKDVRTLSSESPVSFQGGQRALTTMLQYGVEAKNITGTLRTLAEITGGNTERMESLSLAYAQANAAGRLMGQELLQMVNAGFNPLKVISEQTGKSMADLKAEMQDGQISFAMVEQAFKDATREGGQFYGLLDEISNTTAGKLNRARSAVEQFGIAFGDMLKPATDGTLDLFIDDLTRIARLAQMIADVKVGAGSLVSMLANTTGLGAASGALKLPSYIEDIAAAKAQVDPGTNKFSGVVQGKAEAIKRLKGSYFVSDEEVTAAEEYLKVIAKIKSAIEDGKDSKAFAGLTDEEKAGADFLIGETAKAKRGENKGLASFDKDVEGYKKLRDASKDFNDTQKAFIALVEKHGQGRFSQKDIEFYKRAVEAQEKLTAASKEQQRVQEALKGIQDAAKKDLMGSRYGDKAGNVAALQEQATGAERKRLDAMIAAGAAYNDLVLAANDEAQANMDALDAIQEKTKAIEEAAAAEKKATEAQAKFEENERQRFKARRNKYLADLKGLEDEADQMRRNANPNSALIEGLAKAELLKSRGIITDDEFNAERSRLAGDAVKNISAAANPVIGKGTQEAYQFITGQQVDTLTLQLKETEKQTILATTAVDVAKRSQELLEELVEGIPEVVGP